MDVLPDIMVIRCDIIIIENHRYKNRLEDPFINVISIDDIKYELRSIASIEYKDGVKYTSDIYSCRGNKQSSWWYQKRNSRSIQSRTRPRLKHGVRTIATYDQLQKSDVNSLNSEFTKYIGR